MSSSPSNDPLVVEFKQGHNGLMGTLVRTSRGVKNKVVFVDRSHRKPLPKPGEVWIVQLLRDTQPWASTGALIVRPLRQLTWGWQEVGEPVEGLRRQEPVCEIPDLRTGAPESEFGFAAREARNAAYEAALKRAHAFGRSPINAAFVATYGRPLRVEPTETPEQTRLVWARGDRVVATFTIGETLGWAPVLTAAWRIKPSDYDPRISHIEIETRYEEAPDLRTWTRVGAIRDGVPSFTEVATSLLPTVRAAIVAAVRPGIPAAATVAQEDFARAKSYTEHVLLREPRSQRRGLRGPGTPSITARTVLRTVGYPASDDGWRPAGATTERVEEYTLRMERKVGDERINVLSRPEYTQACGGSYGADHASVHAELLARAETTLQNYLATLAVVPCEGRSLTPEFLPDAEAWNTAYRTTYTALAEAYAQQVHADDEAEIRAAHEEFADYVRAAEKLTCARAALADAVESARRVNHEPRLPRPSVWVGGFSRDALETETAAFEGYTLGLTRRVAEVLHAREAAALAKATACVEGAVADAPRSPDLAAPRSPDLAAPRSEPTPPASMDDLRARWSRKGRAPRR